MRWRKEESGEVFGLVFAPQGKLVRALNFTFTADRIAQIEVVSGPERLRQLDLAVLTER